MASNPYGITEVNIPALLGLHQQVKQQRIEDLVRQRKIEMEDREIAKDEKRAGILARLFAKGGDPASGDTGAAQPSAMTAPAPSPTPATQEEAPRILSAASQSKRITPQDAQRVRMSLGPNGQAKFEQWVRDNGIVVGEGQATEAEAPAIPSALPAPAQRADGLKINPDALQELFAVDPEAAMKFQDYAAKADKAQLEKLAAQGETRAKVAKYLMQFPQGQERNAAFQSVRGDMLAQGFSEEGLNSAILTDAMLRRDVAMGMGLKDLIAQENSDRTFAATERERALDNARADAAAERARRAESRAQVRFNERDKDRAALAASGGGVRTDISDLDY